MKKGLSEDARMNRFYDEYSCTSCGAVGPYRLFDEHVGECMRGAPELKPSESFDNWSERVKEWRRELRGVQD